MTQVDLVVHPTRTIYRFEELGVRLTVSFITPALPADLMLLSWPVTYVEFGMESLDGREHQVDLFFQLPAQLCVDDGTHSVVAVRPAVEGLTVVGFGAAEQRMLQRSGDDLRIDWGWAYCRASRTGSSTARPWSRAAPGSARSWPASRCRPVTRWSSRPRPAGTRRRRPAPPRSRSGPAR